MAKTDTGKADTKAEKKITVFYWLKVPSYMNDTDIWPTGVYRTHKQIERFDKSETKYVERFDDEIPETVLFDIAKKFGISIESADGKKGKFRPAEDILEELVIDR